MSKLKSTEIKLISAFLLVAGVIGFFFIFFSLFSQDGIFNLILHLFALTLFTLTTYSGYLLLKENEKGLEIARAIVALELVNFNIAGLGYSFVTGAYVYIGIVNNRIGFDFGLETRFAVFLLEDTSNFVLRLNILALIVFIYLSGLLKKIQNEDDQDDQLDTPRKDFSEGP